MILRISHLVALSTVVGLLLPGCGSSSSSSHDHLHGEEDGTAVEESPLLSASADEQSAAQDMLNAATADGQLSAGELELFALEAVACTERAGFGLELVSFDGSTGQAVFITAPSESEEEGPEAQIAEGCIETYFGAAQAEFAQVGGPSQEEFEAIQQELIERGTACFEEAGYPTSDPVAALGDESIPSEVRVACGQEMNT